MRSRPSAQILGERLPVPGAHRWMLRARRFGLAASRSNDVSSRVRQRDAANPRPPTPAPVNEQNQGNPPKALLGTRTPVSARSALLASAAAAHIPLAVTSPDSPPILAYDLLASCRCIELPA